MENDEAIARNPGPTRLVVVSVIFISPLLSAQAQQFEDYIV